MQICQGFILLEAQFLYYYYFDIEIPFQFECIVPNLKQGKSITLSQLHYSVS
jgi:hypothetical protein